MAEQPESPGRPNIVNRNQLAKIFGVVPSTINKWQDFGMPVRRKGSRGVPDQFDSAACLSWRIEYVKSVHLAAAKIAVPTSSKARLAEAALKELERDRLMESFVPVEHFCASQTVQFEHLIELLAALPSKVAPLVANETNPRKLQAILLSAMNDLRHEMVKGLDEDTYIERVNAKLETRNAGTEH